ncbi:MAG: lysophospholipid acyltransferase family protein [Bryobacteraceae bacterium]
MATKLRAWLVTAPLIVLATAVMGTLSWLASLADASGNLAHRIARLWSRILIRVSGLRVTVEGLEKIDSDRNYVIASNHLSLMDTPLVLAYLPLQFRFLAKRSLFRVPFIGGHLKRAGHVAIPREDARGSLKAMAEAAQMIREKGVSALVFPEGGRSMGQLQEFKEGAAYIAIKAGVPLVPVAIQGTLEVLPMGSVTVRPGRVRMQIGDPISTIGMGLQDRAVLTTELRAQIERMLAS